MKLRPLFPGFLAAALIATAPALCGANRVGEETASYFQIEYAPDGSGNMAWNEHQGGGSSVWLGKVGLLSGLMTPLDGRGTLISSLETQAGYVQWGIDSQGLFMVFPKKSSGLLTIARLQPDGTAIVTDLPTPANVLRDTVYGSLYAGGQGWISSLHDGHAWVVSLANPGTEIMISGDLPVDATGPRWVPGRQVVIFGVKNGTKNQIWQVDVSSGTPSAPMRITDNRNYYEGAFPFIMPDGKRALVAGMNRSGMLALLVEGTVTSFHSVQGVFVGATTLKHPRVTSPEPFISNGKAYAMFSQYAQSTTEISDAYHQPGEIWLADLSSSTPVKLISSSGPPYRFEPEPLYGGKWGFYSSKNAVAPKIQLWQTNLSASLAAPITLLPQPAPQGIAD